jgi:pimeloyl-ACP methyl ester carboxylesterase
VLQTWSIEDRIHEVQLPVLMVNGRYDKVTDPSTIGLFLRIPKVRWITFDKSSHMPFWEERERYAKVVDAWLRMPQSESLPELV